MSGDLKLSVIGIDINSASPEARAEYHLTQSQIIKIYQQKQIGHSFFILATCNRTEIYFMNGEPDSILFQSIQTIFSRIDPTQFYSLRGDDAWLHLLELAIGLKSMLIGETEILGQIRASIQLRQEYEAFSREQLSAFDKVIAAARKIRHRTRIGGFSSSLYTLVIRELKKEQVGFNELRTLILGNGTIAQNLARVLCNHELPTTVLVRNNGITLHSKPQPVIDGVTMVSGYEHLCDLLRTHTLIITATAAPHFILKPEHREFLRGKILIDLSFPRNIDPDLGRNGDSRLWDLEYFGAIAKVNRRNKVQAIAAAKVQAVAALKIIKQRSARLPTKMNLAKLTG